MKSLDEMDFYVDRTKAGRFVAKVWDIPGLSSRAHKSRLDAVDEIVTLAAERIREIDLGETA